MTNDHSTQKSYALKVTGRNHAMKVYVEMRGT